MRVLVLTANKSFFTPCVVDHFNAICNVPGWSYAVRDPTEKTANVEGLTTDNFDVAIVHYPARLCKPGYVSPVWLDALHDFRGLKVTFAQDEYEGTEYLRRALEHIGSHIHFTIIPPEGIEEIFPKERFPSTLFIPVLTGYVPPSYPVAPVPLDQKNLFIGYRASLLPPQYGLHGMEKTEVAFQAKSAAKHLGLPVDIEVGWESRLLSDAWLEMLARSQCTLIAESGSSIWDPLFHIKSKVNALIRAFPNGTWQQTYEMLRLELEEDNGPSTRQISPRCFEAAYHRTLMIGYEGEYSGIIRPWEHYIPVKKDGTDMLEALKMAQDYRVRSRIVETAHRDLIASGRYGYDILTRKLQQAVEMIMAEH